MHKKSLRPKHWAKLLAAVALMGWSSMVHAERPTIETHSAQVVMVGTRGHQTLKLELAVTEAERQRGLMGRTSLAGIDGMLFVFPTEQEHIFWMHQTPLSLDILFFGSDGRCRGWLEQVPPRNDHPRTVHQPSRYVVELRAGTARARGLDCSQAHLVFDPAWASP